MSLLKKWLVVLLTLMFTFGSLCEMALAKATYPTVSDVEFNNTDDIAMKLPFKTYMDGTLSKYDTDDCFVFTLSQAQGVKITFKSYMKALKLTLVGYKGAIDAQCAYDQQYFSANQSRTATAANPLTKAYTQYLPAGTYVIRVNDTTAAQSGKYQLLLEAWNPPAVKSLKVTKSLKIVAGFSKKLTVSYSPSAALQPTYAFTSAKKSIAKVDADGVVTGVKKGKTTVTVKAGKAKAKATIQVVANEFNRSKPLKGTRRGIVSSTKRLYFSGANLVAEVFLYNQTGGKVSQVEDIYVDLYDLAYSDEEPIKSVKFGTHKSSFKNKTYKTIRCVFPAEDLVGVNLNSGRYQAIADADSIYSNDF